MGWVMTSYSLRDRTAALMLAAGFALGFIAFTSLQPAFAQAQATAAEDEESTDEPAKADETKPADTAEVDANTLDWSQLNLDPATLTYGPKAPARSASTDVD